MPRIEAGIEAEIDIEVWCYCGAGLCDQSEGGREHITVKPCDRCIENANQEGYKEGYDDSASMDIDIWCSCGANISSQPKGRNGRITIDPCYRCIEKAKNEGYKEGYDDAESSSDS